MNLEEFNKTDAEALIGKNVQVVVDMDSVSKGVTGQVKGWQEDRTGTCTVIVNFARTVKWLSKTEYYSHLKKVAHISERLEAHKKNPAKYIENIDKKVVYVVECGSCSHFHRVDYFGDCRNDSERFTDIADASTRLRTLVVENYNV